MAAASNFEQNLDILTKAAELTHNLETSEQNAVIGLLKLNPEHITNDNIRLEIQGVKNSLIENIKKNKFDHSMLKTVKAIHSQYLASKQGGRRKRRKSRKTKRKRRKSRKRKKRTKKRALRKRKRKSNRRR